MAVTFDLPEGFQLPENVESGQTFDAVASLKMADDGQVQLVAVDGIPLQGVTKSDDSTQPSPASPGSPAQQSSGEGQADNSGNSFLHAMQ